MSSNGVFSGLYFPVYGVNTEKSWKVRNISKLEIFSVISSKTLQICQIEKRNYKEWENQLLVIIINIKTYIWNPFITKWFFSLQLKSKNENAKSIYLLFTKENCNKKCYH